VPDCTVRRLRLLRGRDRLTDSGLSYTDAVRALTERGRFGISLGLDRVTRLMDELGRPDAGLRGALVAGTNGKGSVVAMVRAVLGAAGLRVGTMPKPHLVSYRERIAIDGTPVDETTFAAAVERVLPAIDRVAAPIGPPTEFEALTAAAITELARQRVDLAVVEVGMGGRLDATNVLDLGVAAITNVQHDHERYLGRTLTAIGGEKAAIIKPGNLAVTGAAGRGLRPILDRCTAVGAPLLRAGPRQAYRAVVLAAGWDGIVVDARTPGRRLRDLHIGLLGGHQAQNAAVALALLDALRLDGERQGRPLAGLDEAALRTGMAAVRWPGRLELLTSSRYGRLLLDGAHNPAGAEALAAALGELGLRRPVIVLGAMRGKRVTGVLRALAPLDPRFIFTRVADRGALPPASLARTWRRIAARRRPVVADDPAAALERAAELRAGDDPIVIAGSLYLVGAVRGMIVGE
jgi:dihydrofolate synthase / folylpolyglutamate synthase